MEINRQWPRWCINKNTGEKKMVSHELELDSLREDGWVTMDEFHGRPSQDTAPAEKEIVSPKGKGKKKNDAPPAAKNEPPAVPTRQPDIEGEETPDGNGGDSGDMGKDSYGESGGIF